MIELHEMYLKGLLNLVLLIPVRSVLNLNSVSQKKHFFLKYAQGQGYGSFQNDCFLNNHFEK